MRNTILMLLLVAALQSCQGQQPKKANEGKPSGKAGKFTVEKTDAQWQQQLTPEQYEVLRNKATERAFTGEYVNTFDAGIYVCAACNNPLFYSNDKFHSDCGWPSFDKAIKGSVIYETDNSFGMKRVEVMCAKCGGHLGHVFDDGPKETTGERFCTNSVSVKFIPKK